MLAYIAYARPEAARNLPLSCVAGDIGSVIVINLNMMAVQCEIQRLGVSLSLVMVMVLLQHPKTTAFFVHKTSLPMIVSY